MEGGIVMVVAAYDMIKWVRKDRWNHPNICFFWVFMGAAPGKLSMCIQCQNLE